MSNRGNMPVPPKWSGQDKRFGETVKNNLDVLCGYAGSPLDRAITARDLLDSGIAKLAVGSVTFSGGSSGLAPPTNDIVYDTPPAATNLVVSGAFQNMLLSWNIPLYEGHSYTEVHRHTSDSISDATLAGQSSSTVGLFSDPVGGGQTYYYWVRLVNKNGVAGPFNQSGGTQGQTSPDITKLLSLLAGSISESQLATNLGAEISRISGPATTANTVAYRIAEEASNRSAAITVETNARVAAVSAEANARGAAVTAARDALQAQINDIAGIAAWSATTTYTVEALWSTSQSYAIDDVVRHGDKLWKALAINSASEPTSAGNPEASTNSNWQLTGDYVSKKVRHNDKLWAALVTSTDSEPSSSNSNWSLIGDYTSLGSVTAANSAAILAINTVDSTSTSAAALAIKALQTTVGGAEGVIATADSLDTLTNAVNHTGTGLEATADKLTSLQTAVFNDMTGVPNWVGTDSSATPPTTAVAYGAGARVVHDKKLYRAIAPSTNVAPPAISYWALDTVAAASAVTALSNTLTSDYATADATEVIEAAMLNSLTGVSNWDAGTLYSQGNRVIYEKRLYRAVAASENVIPGGVDTSKWVSDSITTASVLASSEATAATTYATATNLTNLESATFGNLTGLSAYDENTTYTLGSRVTHGTGADKKIYIAILESSASNKQAPTETAYWDEDTLASQAVTNAALGGKENTGAAAQALTSANTYTDTNAAKASEFTALNAAVFENVVGLNAWANTSAYAFGDRVYHDQRIYKSRKATLEGLSSWSSSTTYAVDAIVKYTNGGVTLPYKCLVANSNATPHDNISGENPKWAIDTSEPVVGGNDYWVIDAASLASAVSALTTDVEDNYARATDVTALDASIFGGASGAPAWSNQQSYAVGARVTHDDILYKAIQASTNQAPQQPPNAAFWAIARFATGSALTELSVEVGLKATTSSLTTLESNIYANVTDPASWVNGTTYNVNDLVTYDGKIYRALQTTAATVVIDGISTTVFFSPSVTAYWQKVSLTTAAEVEAEYAKSSDVSVLQSNLFNNLVGVDEWNSNTTYSAGARVVHTTATGVKKLYKSEVDNNIGNLPPSNLGGSTPKWALDTLASATAVNSLTTFVNADVATTGYVDGQFTTKVGDLGGTSVASTLSQYNTRTEEGIATLDKIDAATAVIFADITGKTGWLPTVTYNEGDTVFTRGVAYGPVKIYKSKQGNNYNKNPTAAENSAWWELETLAFAGALDTLNAIVTEGDSSLVSRTSGVEAQLDDLGTTTVQQSFDAQASKIGGLEAQYTVKIDSNGHVAGFGLATTVDAADNSTSSFYVNADRFGIMPNQASSDTANWTSGRTYINGDQVISGGQIYIANSTHNSESGVNSPPSSKWESGLALPFVVQQTSEVIEVGGSDVSVPAGVYMDTAYIKNASIESAKIKEVTAEQITSGYINVTERINANDINADKLNIDNQYLDSTVDANGNSVLILATGSQTKGVKYENLSFDAVGVIAQGSMVNPLYFTANQTAYPFSFTQSAPIYEYTVTNLYYPLGSTSTLPVLMTLNLASNALKESGDYYIDFGASPFGGVPSTSSVSASQVMLQVNRYTGSAWVSHGTSTTPAKYYSSHPLNDHSKVAVLPLSAGVQYQFKLYGHLKGFVGSNVNQTSGFGYQGGYIRVFRIHKTT